MGNKRNFAVQVKCVCNINCIMSEKIKANKNESNLETFCIKRIWKGLEEHNSDQHILNYKNYISSCLIREWRLTFFSPLTCLFSTWSAFLLRPLFFILFSLPLSLSSTRSHCIAPVSRLPARQCGPGGSNQLNYWEHKNAAANGSWINTLAKLLPRLPLLPQGIKLKILRLRMQRLEATAEALSEGWAAVTTRPGRPGGFFRVQRADIDACDLLTVEAAKDVKTGRPMCAPSPLSFPQFNLL